MKILFLILFIFFVLNVSSQNNDSQKSHQRDTVSNLQYTWNGKNVTYRQMRDSLAVLYFKFCDSLKKDEEGKIKINK
jgi:hypothetical protein